MLITRLIHEDDFRQEFETNREKCLRGFCLSEVEKQGIASLDLGRFLGGLHRQQPMRGAHPRAIKGGSAF